MFIQVPSLVVSYSLQVQHQETENWDISTKSQNHTIPPRALDQCSLPKIFGFHCPWALGEVQRCRWLHTVSGLAAVFAGLVILRLVTKGKNGF